MEDENVPRGPHLFLPENDVNNDGIATPSKCHQDDIDDDEDGVHGLLHNLSIVTKHFDHHLELIRIIDLQTRVRNI